MSAFELEFPIDHTNQHINTQQRITAFQRELELSKRELMEVKHAIANADEDCAALHQDLLSEREARTNEQGRADALALEVGVERVKRAVAMKLLERMAQAYGDEDVIAMAEVMQDVWAALKVEGQS